MADAKIRILDLVGSLGKEDEFIEEYKNYKSETIDRELDNICEDLFDITGTIYLALLRWSENIGVGLDRLAIACYEIEQLAKHHNIDLDWHIEMKMRYNETREYKHGKGY